MSDDTKPRPLKVTTCFDPTGRNPYCYALVEDTDDTRREHRAWHAHEEAVKKGMRDAIKDRDDAIADLRQEVADLRGDVKEIELPEATLGIEISRDGWTDTEEASADAEDVTAPTVQVDPSGLYTPATVFNAVP